ncbi:hypothetical protein C8Q80DRAFT_1152095 [Daedaleopsis nitida]|nr:hypothetical protein C8Q80DRAFT_1152095 [Daedaleopsis nitida]
MSVEHALQCHDIVVEIFQHLYIPSDLHNADDYGDRLDWTEDAAVRLNLSTLACAARACRTFSGPALDILWRDLPDILSLSRILPHHEGTIDNGYTFALHDPNEYEWCRFMEYANRVQLTHAYGREIHPDAWNALTRRRNKSGSLFPRLKSLHLCWNDDTPLESLSHLLAPSLTLLLCTVNRVAKGILENMMDALRGAVSRQCHTIYLTPTYSLSPRHAALVIFPFWELSQLRALHLIERLAVTSFIIRALSSFQHLRTLSLKVSYIRDRPSTLQLQLLEILEVEVESFEDAASLLVDASLPQLQQAKLKIELGRNQQGTSYIAEIVSALATEHLQSLCVEIENCSRPLEATAFFSPLLNSPQLNVLKLGFLADDDEEPLQVNLRDEDLRSAISAWPLLRELKLTVTYHMRYDYYRKPQYGLPKLPAPPPTIQSLAAFAEAHPRLEVLQLPYVCIPADMIVTTTLTLGSGSRTQSSLALDSLSILDHGLRELEINTWGVLDLKAAQQSQKHSDREGSEGSSEEGDRGNGSEDGVFESEDDSEESEDEGRPPGRIQPLYEFAVVLDRLFPNLELPRYTSFEGWPDAGAPGVRRRLFELLDMLQRGRRVTK